MASAYLFPESDDKVYVDDIAQVGGASVVLICALSLSFWYLFGLVIINPLISVVVGFGAVVFNVMGMMMSSRRLGRSRG